MKDYFLFDKCFATLHSIYKHNKSKKCFMIQYVVYINKHLPACTVFQISRQDVEEGRILYHMKLNNLFGTVGIAVTSKDIVELQSRF